ncbi:MAG: cytochrome c-type biogenesis protein [Vicinamibacteria bacterium]
MKWPEGNFVLALSLALSAATVAAQERLSTPEYREACAALMCQCGGCSATVYTCAMEHCHSAEPIREEIAERIQKGESAEDVVKVFEERYGLAILSAPPASGFHLTAWIAPFAVLLAGFFVTRRVLQSWKRQTAGADAGVVEMAAHTPAPISEAQRARIEKELRELSS